MRVLIVAIILTQGAAFAFAEEDEQIKAALAQIERLEKLMPKMEPLPEVFEVPEPMPIQLEVDLGGDLAIGITPRWWTY